MTETGHDQAAALAKELSTPERNFDVVAPDGAETRAFEMQRGTSFCAPRGLGAVCACARRSAGAARTPRRKFWRRQVTSPLTRALQTTAHIVKTQHQCDVLVTSLHTETGRPVPGDDVAGRPCQKGRAVAALRREYPGDWDWSRVCSERDWLESGGGWLNPRTAEDRLEPFRIFLNSLPLEKDVLVVGHSGFFKKLLGQDQKMGNCEVVTRALDGGPERGF